jgi:murein DD-endopeptidase MepM/ murein hydrolase activator NlpD
MTCRGHPRTQYQKVTLVIGAETPVDEVRKIIGLQWSLHPTQYGPSADDAGVGDLDSRTAIVVNWPELDQAWYDEHYPGVECWPLDYENDLQLEGRLLAYDLKRNGLVLGNPSSHTEPCVTHYFGEMMSYGLHKGIDLRGSWAQWGDEALAAYPGKIIWAGHLDNGLGTQVWEEITVPDGRKVVLRYGHLVPGSCTVRDGDTVEQGHALGKLDNSGNSFGDHLHFEVRVTDQKVADSELLIDFEPPVPMLRPVGLHDLEGIDWMARNGLCGVGLALAVVQFAPVTWDFSAWLGVDVVLRVNWGYGEQGTLPPAGKETEWAQIIGDGIRSLKLAKGQKLYLTVTNEYNSTLEWRGGPAHPTEIVTPERYAKLYNAVCRVLPARDDVLVAPGALDPFNVLAQYFGQPGDPRTWAEHIYATAERIDWIALHAKTQGGPGNQAIYLTQCDPNTEVGSQTFTDWPLVGRYMHLRTVEDQISWLPTHLRTKPRIVTELNPQRCKDGALGWDDNAPAWIRAAVSCMDQYDAASILYRFPVAGPQAPFALQNQPEALAVVSELCKRRQ